MDAALSSSYILNCNGCKAKLEASTRDAIFRKSDEAGWVSAKSGDSIFWLCPVCQGKVTSGDPE